jgi:hypothetical protein
MKTDKITQLIEYTIQLLQVLNFLLKLSQHYQISLDSQNMLQITSKDKLFADWTNQNVVTIRRF